LRLDKSRHSGLDPESFVDMGYLTETLDQVQGDGVDFVLFGSVALLCC